MTGIRLYVRNGCLALAGWFFCHVPLGGQGLTGNLGELCQKPCVNIPAGKEEDAPEAAARTGRVRLFGLPNDLGIINEEESPREEAPPVEEELFPALQITLGNYNPNLDLRRPGVPARLGYYKMFSELQIFDLGPTVFSLGLQAFTPAGVEAGGLASGRTVVSPAFCVLHQLGEGQSVQGFVGQNIHAKARWRPQLDNQVQVGVSYQYPVLAHSESQQQGLFFFVQALGYYQGEPATNPSQHNQWEVIPGLHWRWKDQCWMSFGASRWNFLTCSWQY